MIQSPYRRGADDGFYFGLYLTAMFFSSIFSQHFALLSLLSMAMIVLVPFVIYRFMRSYNRDLGHAASFPMLWMQGVVIFFCGILISGAALVVYMKWIEPDFVINQLHSVADMAGMAPGTMIDSAADMASKMLDAQFIPTPMAIVTELIMLAIASGSILSIILSAVFAIRRKSLLKA